jgi:hypothetical protein
MKFIGTSMMDIIYIKITEDYRDTMDKDSRVMFKHCSKITLPHWKMKKA